MVVKCKYLEAQNDKFEVDQLASRRDGLNSGGNFKLFIQLSKNQVLFQHKILSSYEPRR